jgi:hypothetical protein
MHVQSVGSHLSTWKEKKLNPMDFVWTLRTKFCPNPLNVFGDEAH